MVYLKYYNDEDDDDDDDDDDDLKWYDDDDDDDDDDDLKWYDDDDDDDDDDTNIFLRSSHGIVFFSTSCINSPSLPCTSQLHVSCTHLYPLSFRFSHLISPFLFF